MEKLKLGAIATVALFQKSKMLYTKSHFSLKFEANRLASVATALSAAGL